jgi:hypothetical protein
MDVAEIEKRVDRIIAGPVPINTPDMEGAGLVPRNWGEAMEAAKLLAISGAAVPKYLRGNPGGCFAITMRAMRWGMDPFAVAEKSYIVINKGDERISYEAQLIHAVITSNAPLKGRLRHEIIGEGDERRCKVWGTFKGEDKPHEYTSPTLKQMRDARGRNEYGGTKGSPYWDTLPEVQLTYSTVRQWCRLFASEVILGVYAPDELDDGSKPADNQLEAFKKRIKESADTRVRSRRGFDQARIANEVAGHTIIDGDANTGVVKEEDTNVKRNDESGVEGRQPSAGDREGHADDTVASAGADRGPAEGGKADAGPQAAQVEDEDQSQVFPPDRKPKQQPQKGKRR